MATTETIIRTDGRKARAAYVRHLRTLCTGYRSDEVDLYRLEDGTEIECISPTADCRVLPRECDPRADRYPGHRPGA